jgi:hypothetical protein
VLAAKLLRANGGTRLHSFVMLLVVEVYDLVFAFIRCLRGSGSRCEWLSLVVYRRSAGVRDCLRLRASTSTEHKTVIFEALGASPRLIC